MNFVCTFILKRHLVLGRLLILFCCLSFEVTFAQSNTCSSLFNTPDSKITKLETMVLFKDKIDELLNYPTITPDISLIDLKALPVGSYKLNDLPSISLIKTLIQWGMEKQEANLQSYRGHWIVTLSDKMEADTPERLHPILISGLLSFNLHTHPSQLAYSSMPSFPDVSHGPSRTIQRTAYIASPYGISKMTNPYFANPNVLLEFQVWAKKKGRKINSNEYRLTNEWKKDFIQYLEEFYSFELIPWSDAVRIEKILSEGSYDPVQDQKFKHDHPTADMYWPGKPAPQMVGPFKFFPDSE